MRYKPQQSNTTKCLNSCDETVSYFRKRPIVVCILITIMCWMFLAFRWSSNRSLPSEQQSTKPITKDLPPVLIQEHPKEIVENNNEIIDKAKPKESSNDEMSIESKVSNAKKVLVTYGQNCCASAKVF